MAHIMPESPRPGVPAVTNPFDAIRQVRPDGSEVWSARALMLLMGYDRWHNFQTAIERAIRAAENTGTFTPEAFYRLREEGTGGAPRTDYLLNRYGAYLVALNGDPVKKPLVAAAQAYFVVRTRQAEVQEAEAAVPVWAPPPVRVPRATDPVNPLDLPLSYREALEALLGSVRACHEAEEQVQELAPAARSWELLASPDRAGDFTVAEAAQTLCRAGIRTGQNRLMDDMKRWGWVTPSGRPYQRTVDRGWMVLRTEQYEHGETGEARVRTQARVRPAGLNAAHDRLVHERQVPLPRFPGRAGPQPLAGNPDRGDGPGDWFDVGVEGL
ncbi:phage antirepressor KilAC domain-containing protein [Streptomyces sp. NBC_01439]|uniref:phage antirepressor KilAC domain-containing protein n=1 Tax=Streptomyces sp. NBC_01439 TaxID=2903867 RepID=UPI002E2A69E5|nr:phage antirepressor KilAC domain-containing protein [Streptomyces sp. NBC_01439]